MTHLRPRRPPAAAGAIALALCAALVMAACSSGSGSSSTGSSDAGETSTNTTVELTAFDGEDFYEVPDPLPEGPHGTLIRYAEVPEMVVPGATAYRIMYLSESLEGDPIAVTGIASVPEAPAPEGGRPQITISHGTTGIADECAPSKNPALSEFSMVALTEGDQFLVAATDYEGLGTPGRHPYLVGESEGRSSIDALLAARELPNADGGDRFVTAGYSQGGHGALWTSQVAAEWAPDLEVIGTFGGAPASEVDVILTAAGQIPALSGFAYLVVAGLEAAYPEADPALFLTTRGVELLDAVDTGCAPATFAAVAGIAPGDLIRADAADAEPWKTLGIENNAGTAKTNDAPTLIIHSRQDETVPLPFSNFLLDRMCANDQVVERRLLDAGGHGAAAVPAYEQALDWLSDRFTDTPNEPVDSCAG